MTTVLYLRNPHELAAVMAEIRKLTLDGKDYEVSHAGSGMSQRVTINVTQIQEEEVAG